MAVALTSEELQTALKGLGGWQLRDNKLYRQFEFANFAEAFAFMTKVALQAEKIDHHPDWANSYNTVEISLISHDLGALSARDLALAEAINRQFGG